MEDSQQKLEVAANIFAKGRKAWTKGSRDEALNLFRKALAIQESVVGPFDKHTAKTYYWVGFALKTKQEYDKALVAYRRTLRIRLSLFGEDDISTDDVKRALKDVLLEMKFEEEAIEEYLKNVKESVNAEKEGNLFAEKGDSDQAVESYQKFLSIEESARGKFPLDVANIHKKIADVYKNKEEPDMAMTSYREALGEFESKLGRAHPDTVACLTGIETSGKSKGFDEGVVKHYCSSVWESLSHTKRGDELMAQEEYDKAIEEFEAAIDIEETSLGKYPLTTASIYRRVAMAFRSLGRFDRSILTFRTTLTIFIFGCGSDHPTVLTTLKEIGQTLKAKGVDPADVNKYLNTVSYSVKYERYGEHIYNEGDFIGAIEEFQKSMSLEAAALGKFHLTQASLFRNIGRVSAAQGKYDIAIKNHRTALLIYLPHLGRSHSDSLNVIWRLGYAVEDKGNSADVVENYREKVPNSIEFELTGDRLLETGEYERAIAAFATSISMEESTLGQFHLCTADLYFKVASALEALKLYDRALSKHREVLAINTIAMDIDHPNSQKALEDLRNACKLKGLGEKDAVEYGRKATNSIRLERSGDELVFAQSFDQALSDYSTAITLEEAVLGKGCLTVAGLRAKIADVYRKRGDPNNAIIHYRRAIRIQICNNAPDHDDGGRTMDHLLLAVQDLGFVEGVGRKYQKVVRDAIQNEIEADADKEKGLRDDAIRGYRRAIAMEESALGKLHPVTMKLYQKIADLCRDKEDYESALLFYSKLFAIRESYKGKDDPETLKTFNDLVVMAQREAVAKGAGFDGWATLKYVLTCLIGLLILLATLVKSLSHSEMPIKKLRIAAYETEGEDNGNNWNKSKINPVSEKDFPEEPQKPTSVRTQPPPHIPDDIPGSEMPSIQHARSFDRDRGRPASPRPSGIESSFRPERKQDQGRDFDLTNRPADLNSSAVGGDEARAPGEGREVWSPGDSNPKSDESTENNGAENPGLNTVDANPETEEDKELKPAEETEPSPGPYDSNPKPEGGTEVKIGDESDSAPDPGDSNMKPEEPTEFTRQDRTDPVGLDLKMEDASEVKTSDEPNSSPDLPPPGSNAISNDSPQSNPGSLRSGGQDEGPVPNPVDQKSSVASKADSKTPPSPRFGRKPGVPGTSSSPQNPTVGANAASRDQDDSEPENEPGAELTFAQKLKAMQRRASANERTSFKF